MHSAITDMTDNIGGMATRHPSTHGLPPILPLNIPVVWNHHADLHL